MEKRIDPIIFVFYNQTIINGEHSNMVSANSDVLNYFWLPKNCYNTCVSGANANTIEEYHSDPHIRSSQEYFYDITLPKLKRSTTPYPANQKYLRKSRKYALGFRDVVNDALREVYNGAKGYVFTIEQLTEIVKFVPDVNVVKSNGIFYVSKEN